MLVLNKKNTHTPHTHSLTHQSFMTIFLIQNLLFRFSFAACNVHYIIICDNEYCLVPTDFTWKFWFCMIEQFSLILHEFACCLGVEVVLSLVGLSLEVKWKLWSILWVKFLGKRYWDRQIHSNWFSRWYTSHASSEIQLCFADEDHHYSVTFS